jgi:cell fate (sporulation/competence/biofilm development) regulator YmcA (YheA/YmcA/DUF963 family)
MTFETTLDTLYEKADAIAHQIQTSEAASRFWQAKEKMQRHLEAQQLFEELKRKTNHALVIEEQLSLAHPRYQSAQGEVDSLLQRLAEIPVAMQYKEAQDELNSLVQEVVQVLLNRLTPVLPVELGPKQGCGQGHDGNGCSCGNH